jgi:hypothetical protein
MNFNISKMFLRSRIYRFWLGAVSGRFVPIRYYITEFLCWVVCGIDFYKDYKRFYQGQNQGQNDSDEFFCLQDKCSSQCENCKNIYDAG